MGVRKRDDKQRRSPGIDRCRRRITFTHKRATGGDGVDVCCSTSTTTATSPCIGDARGDGYGCRVRYLCLRETRRWQQQGDQT